jgi:quinol monooxygenase YgiN
MIGIRVRARVKHDRIDEFKEATAANAVASRREPGVARFDILQDADDPAVFTLVEIYRTAEGVAAHKETAHYRTWRDTVADMMAEPRASTRFLVVSPDDRD